LVELSAESGTAIQKLRTAIWLHGQQDSGIMRERVAAFLFKDFSP